MSSTQVAKSIHERFHELRDDWKSKTRHLSNTAQISLMFSYQKIIGMGPAGVPLILSELEKEPDHWFWARRPLRTRIRLPRSTPVTSRRRRVCGSSGGVIKACW